MGILLYTKSHDFATLEAGLSFGCNLVRYTSVKNVYGFDCNSDVVWCIVESDSVRYTSVKKVYGFDCNSDVVWCFASCIDFIDVLLYTKSHDFATLEVRTSFGCDSVRYTSVKKVYVFDCNSDVVWCFASCTDFVDVLLYTKIHDFAK